MKKEKTLKYLFSRSSKKENGCIEWEGTRTQNGYGTVDFAAKIYVVSRLVVSLSGIEIPKGFQVCHKCDNPPCINPEHLFVGTARDNANDAMEKGRRKERAEYKLINRRSAEHGTKTMYSSYGCRCNSCTEANRKYIQSYRKKKKSNKNITYPVLTL